MSRAIKCKLILHGSSRQFDMGVFDSILKAKQYVRECWNRPYTIIKLK
jgi:hypothetical protein